MKKLFFIVSIILLVATSKTQAQNDTIFYWKSGVMIYKHSIKTADLDSISFKRPIAVGQFYKGGIIAYIFKPGDSGYIVGQTHGLIAATSNQSSGATWWNGTYTTTGATGTALGTGSNNTNLIIASQGNTGTYAAKLCRDYSGGGFTDWFLPSKDELEKLYLNRTLIGGFSYWHWSSTDLNNNYVWCQGFQFNTTTGTGISKAGSASVRAIRRF